jgi:hypothetical protein
MMAGLLGSARPGTSDRRVYDAVAVTLGKYATRA